MSINATQLVVTLKNVPHTLADVPTETRLERLYALNLSDVKRKMMEPYPEGKGWSSSQVEQAELWYKRYLHAIIVEPEVIHVPNGPIDALWHMHILSTKQYREDCAWVLGYFLDHYPFYGMNGDAEERDDSFDETNAVYHRLFGEDCKNMSEFALRSVEPTSCGDSGGGCHGSIPAMRSEAERAASCQQESPCGSNVTAPKRMTCTKAIAAMHCGSGGSGTGCSQKTDGIAAKSAQCNHSGSGTGCGQRRAEPMAAASCNHSGSGTGCGQRSPLNASSCGHGGSGTGCGQGCRREVASYPRGMEVPLGMLMKQDG